MDLILDNDERLGGRVTSPDGESALMPAATRLHHRFYLSEESIRDLLMEVGEDQASMVSSQIEAKRSAALLALSEDEKKYSLTWRRTLEISFPYS